VEQPYATLDTSFWINAFRAGLLIRLGELFHLAVTDAVVEELRYPARQLGMPAPDTAILEEWLASGTLRRENPRLVLPLFGPGESERRLGPCWRAPPGHEERDDEPSEPV
jgi:hypothetical protein